MSPAEKNIAFIEKFIRVPEGTWAGHPLILEDFQKAFIYDVYDNPHRTKRGILSMARKNSKTATISCLVMCHLIGPQSILNGQLVSGALSRDQASLVYNYVEKMVLMNQDLSVLCKLVPSNKRIVSFNTGTEYKALAAEGTTAFGISPNLVILDEIGQIKGPSHLFVDALTTSQGAHRDPLQLVISTQAPTDGDLLSIWIDDALQSKDPRIVCHLYAAENGCDLDDRKAWLASNPGLGRIRSEEDLVSQIQQAMRLPSMENSVRNLLLNQRIQRTSPFLTPTVWKRNSGPVDREIFLDGRPVYGGLDLSARQDLTGMVLTTVADDGHVYMLPYGWTPADTVAERSKYDRAPYDVWVREGHLRALPGNSIPYNLLAEQIVEIVEGMNLVAMAYDRWRLDILQNEFSRMGLALPLEPFGQGYKDMAPAVGEFEAYALDGYLRHGDNPLLTMCIANTAIENDAAGNRKPTKAKSHGRIDIAVAALMSVAAMGRMREKTPDIASLIG